jgi:hypothetical protein
MIWSPIGQHLPPRTMSKAGDQPLRVLHRTCSKRAYETSLTEAEAPGRMMIAGVHVPNDGSAEMTLKPMDEGHHRSGFDEGLGSRP